EKGPVLGLTVPLLRGDRAIARCRQHIMPPIAHVCYPRCAALTTPRRDRVSTARCSRAGRSHAWIARGGAGSLVPRQECVQSWMARTRVLVLLLLRHEIVVQLGRVAALCLCDLLGGPHGKG